MKNRALTFFGLCFASAVLAGCTTDQYAGMLIRPDTSFGKSHYLVLPNSERLVKGKVISAAREVTMPDKTVIDVWLLKADSSKTPPRGTVLVLHGLGDSKVTYRKLAKMLADKGFDVVLTDLRTHGRSTGKFVTYGALEKHDQRRVMDELYGEGIVSGPLYVFGFDLGGSVAIQYAAIDRRVKGVMAMAPYRDMASICRRFAPLISDEQFRKVLIRAGQIGKFDPAEASAMRAMANVRCPVLLVHGQLDLTVPYADSEALLAAATGPKEIESIPWANHISVLFGREADIVKGIEKLAAGQVGKKSSAGK